MDIRSDDISLIVIKLSNLKLPREIIKNEVGCDLNLNNRPVRKRV